jgi:hypothetical protein
MSQSYCAVRISEHMALDANGTLICLAAPICRSGYQTYKASEVDPQSGDDTEMDILRPVAEVTSPATIASFEGVDLTLRHPAKFIDPDTHAWSALGHAQNVRVGPKDKDGNVQLVADLFIKDRSLQEAIERGVRDLSCGYRYDLVQLSNGDWAQVNIRGNHIAVVEDGRAGTSKIMDSKDGGDMDNAKLDRLCGLLEQLLKTSGAGSEEGEDDLPGAATGEAIAEGHPGEALENIGEGVGSVVSSAANLAGAAAMDDDDDPDGNLNPEYELAAGPERRGKAFSALIPTEGSGKGGFVNPVSARDALQSLASPSLRAAVKAGGKKMIDAYNQTVRGLQAQLKAGGRRRAVATDSRVRRHADAADFEAQAARFHGRAIKLHADPNTVDDAHQAEDTRQHEESFEEMAARYGREAQARFMPKRRR